MPSKELSDGIDYVPAHKGMVFGHHYTSIAGTGPIVGPAIAVMWGWLPALIWVLLGSVLVGILDERHEESNGAGRFASALLGEALLVGGGVHQVAHVLGGEPDLDQPAALPRVLGEQLEVILDRPGHGRQVLGAATNEHQEGQRSEEGRCPGRGHGYGDQPDVE